MEGYNILKRRCWDIRNAFSGLTQPYMSLSLTYFDMDPKCIEANWKTPLDFYPYFAFYVIKYSQVELHILHTALLNIGKKYFQRYVIQVLIREKVVSVKTLIN